MHDADMCVCVCARHSALYAWKYYAHTVRLVQEVKEPILKGWW